MLSHLGRWCVNYLICFSMALLGEMDDDPLLVLQDNELEQLVSMTGELQLSHRYSEEDGFDSIQILILKMDPASVEIACKTPVRCAFHSSQSIRHSPNYQELQLTGDYDETWLYEHIGETVTLSGYLWHAHSSHHYTPVMMDTDPWFKNGAPAVQ